VSEHEFSNFGSSFGDKKAEVRALLSLIRPFDSRDAEGYYFIEKTSENGSTVQSLHYRSHKCHLAVRFTCWSLAEKRLVLSVASLTRRAKTCVRINMSKVGESNGSQSCPDFSLFESSIVLISYDEIPLLCEKGSQIIIFR
jgi:hypothetical protein